MSVKALNDYLGALVLTGIIALVSYSIVGYAKMERIDQRITTLEKMQEQQLLINDSVTKLSTAIAVLQDRGQREEPKK